jgi:hypothetical protein
MANTLKFGNGEWYGKKDTILAYNDENSNYKPLPFDFSRASKATVINKDGLIEVVGSGEPRVDYKDNTKGALLLEPSRTNSVLQSNQFDTTWIATNTNVLGGQSGIYGSSDAWKLSENTVNSVHILLQNTTSVSNNTFSIYLKKGTKNKVLLFDGTNNNGAKFNLETQSVHSYYSGPIDYKIEILSDGWARYSISSSNTSSSFRVYMLDDNYNLSYDGNIENYIYIQNAQLEQGSYATSYIPTSGSTVTRLRDECLKDDFSILTVGNSYTLFFDVDLNEKDDNKTFFNIENSSGTTSFTVRSVLGGVIRVYNNLDSQYPTNNLGSSTNKWVVRIDGTSFKIFGAEGSLSGTLTTARDMGEGIFGRYSQTKINDFKVYNTALSDSESEALVN